MSSDLSSRRAHAGGNAEKAHDVAELAAEFTSSGAAILTEYRGLTVKQLQALRSSLGGTTRYTVVKNTLAGLAAATAGISGIGSLLKGPTAIAFVRGEPVRVAKALREFAKANPLLVVKGAVVEGQAVTAEQVRELADLQPRDVLLARWAAAANSALASAPRTAASPAAAVAALLDALAERRAADPPPVNPPPANPPGEGDRPGHGDDPGEGEIPDDVPTRKEKIILGIAQLDPAELRLLADAFRRTFLG